MATNTIYGQIKSIGLPNVKNYKRTDYNGAPQNWGIDQDKKGNIYFANDKGLFQFDGTTWRNYIVPNSVSVHSLKIDESGKIFVGGSDEFGYFEADYKGRLVYHSLSKILKQKDSKPFDDIWKIHIYKGEVLFQAFNAIYIYKNNVVKQLNAPIRFQFSFLVNDQLYIQDSEKGLLSYKSGKLYPLEGTTALNNTEVWGIFTLNKDKILVATLDKGLFIYQNQILTPWQTEANDFCKKNSSLGGISIKDKYIVLNSILSGIIICDYNGKIIQHINRTKGLQNNTVLTSFIDNKNNLWLGLDNGIAFVNENSPFTYFGFSYNISAVYASIVYKDNLYVATNQGLFYHSWKNNANNAIEEPFKLVEGTTGQVWNIQVLSNQLICGHNRGALLISGGKVIQVLDRVGYWDFKLIPNNPNYMIGSNYAGFSLFEKNAGGWHFKNKIDGHHGSIEDFEIDEKSIWIKKGPVVSQLFFSKDLKSFQPIVKHQKLTSKINMIESIRKIKDRVYFLSNNRFFKYSYELNQFYEDLYFSKLFKTIPKIKSINEDQLGNIWYVFNESLGVFMKQKNNGYKNVVGPFSNLTGDLMRNNASINTVDPNNIFIGLTDGLAHFDSNLSNKKTIKPKAYIREFSYPGNKLILGNGQKTVEKYTIPFDSNHLEFSFSSPSYENLDNLEFSYQLEGFDNQWSSWTKKSIKEYTNLREGDYTIKVKARNNYGVQSEIAQQNFTISPPWYRNFLAYVFYFLVVILAVHYTRTRIQMKIRKNKHYETLEQSRLYLEKETKIKQEQFELEKEIERLKNEKLKVELITKNKELVINSLQAVKKNKILNGIIQKLQDIDTESFDESAKFHFAKLNKSIVKEVSSDKSWKDLEKHIRNVHFDFLKRLKNEYPRISSRELDLSTYLIMNMSTKEIAEIMNISVAGVEIARHRLRKKLDLPQKTNLIGFLMSI
ncbi:MAG TPA: triple tyrosine motif-containing protein [Flavobacterium sp.]|uniref:helix-turn-helix and ligand-binding sensor domain-containing protein n=1 Tax=Flavobacterium sp. TaxID=239 RepID=UPI002DB81CFB|nr:triple tyrosine motif-containing protein [Flavobacterium sp.]HEU4790755.1 triple tyrosine motif-containing protein [Flavobacterium sp.]